jgi:hypothetical protein
MDESGSGPLGGKGVTLEADETFFGNKEGGRVDPWYFDNEGGWRKKRMAYSGKIPVVTLVERGGKARAPSKSRTLPLARSAGSFSTTPTPIAP